MLRMQRITSKHHRYHVWCLDGKIRCIHSCLRPDSNLALDQACTDRRWVEVIREDSCLTESELQQTCCERQDEAQEHMLCSRSRLGPSADIGLQQAVHLARIKTPDDSNEHAAPVHMFHLVGSASGFALIHRGSLFDALQCQSSAGERPVISEACEQSLDSYG